jgi:hypothetical protein
MCSVNHDLKAIYIHIPKNGGSYIETILQKYYGFTFDYEIKSNNYGFTDVNNEPLLVNDKRGVLKYYMNSEYLNKKYEMTKEKWETYYKFTFVRNPYNRIISAYEFLKNNYYNDNYYRVNKSIPFPSLFDLFNIQKNGLNNLIYKEGSKELYYYHYYHLFITQIEHLLNNSNKINLNFIGRVENLDIDLIIILKELGVKEHLKHLDFKGTINATFKNDNIECYFNNELLFFVNDFYKDDFYYFGYNKQYNIKDLCKNINFLNTKEIGEKRILLLENKNCIEEKVIVSNSSENVKNCVITDIDLKNKIFIKGILYY